MLHLLLDPVVCAQVRLQHPPKDLEQDLETGLGDGGVVAALAQLVTDEGVLRPRELVPAEDGAGLAQLAPDQVPAPVRHVRVEQAEEEGELGGRVLRGREAREEVERVLRRGRGWARGRRGCCLGAVRAEGAAVDVGGEVGDAGGDAVVELWTRVSVSIA
jgi:hypothetical protein